MINKLTNILGITIISLAASSVFYLDKVNWTDAFIGIMAGSSLIYVKNNDFKSIFSDYLSKKSK